MNKIAMLVLAGLAVLQPLVCHAVPSPSCPSPGMVPSSAACEATAPAVGRTVSGPVLQVIDGRTLCVALGPQPSQWVQVRLAGATGGGSRGALMVASFAQKVDCQVVQKTDGATLGTCLRDGVPLGELLREPAVRTEAAAWR